MPGNDVCFDILTPVNFLKRSASIFREKIAVVYEDRRYTYTEFLSRVNRLANALIGIGVKEGDNVAFICANTPPMLEAHFAVPMIGACLVPINIRLSSSEILYILNHSESSVLFIDTEFSDRVLPVADRLKSVNTFINICDISRDKPFEGMEYEALLNSASDSPPPRGIRDEYDMISLNYTSGSTGMPKGVMVHHRGGYLNALGEIIEFGLSSRSVYLWTLPMFHCNGWCFPWAVTAAGGTHVCLRRVVAENIFRLIEDEQVSHLCAAPTVLITLANHPDIKKLHMEERLQIMTAGAPPSPAIIQTMESIGANVTHVYGLTETFGPHSICEWQNKWNGLSIEEKALIKARQGVPYITASHLDTVDPDYMEPVPHDGKVMGELVMRGNNVMLGYYKDEDATREAFKGGWFHSGDLAVIHPDGYVQIKDRKKDIIISGGENISTVEIENVIYNHPDVLEVAVIPIPDPRWGEVPKAFIKPMDGANPSAEEIIDFCKKNLARFKAPKAVEFCELPKTATGKIQKFKLREREQVKKDG